ncbi:hypothetical protein GT352_00390 [Streptomyces sp. SID1046]|uniref:hypothetical protein n=1 Tax=Streptomyces sp. SID1046 TaxID=2690249 RepID=UPI0013704511|nr:hypothetical protein [Streptomyces sp. SID1046]MYV72423.1 hypothetical protein [Streptomyces sp. SID1046]
MTDKIAEAWVGGLKWNPALTIPVFERLLAADDQDDLPHWLTSRPLDREMTAAVVASPLIKHRLSLIDHARVDVDALAGLARDPSPRIRFQYAITAGDFGRRVPDGVPEVLAGDSKAGVRAMALQWDLPLHVRARLAEDEDARVRGTALTPELWTHLSATVREALLADPAPQVQEAVAAILSDGAEVLPEPKPPLSTPEERVSSGDRSVRWDAALDPDVPTTLALRLAEDPDPAVVLALSMREDLTEEQRSAIAYVVPHGYHMPPTWIVEHGHEPAVARRAAASGHVLLRRSIAMQRDLPADVVDLLARDEDFFVKLTLCQSCAQAPHELVVEMYAYWHGLTWSFLRSHPNFAMPGLARYADHPNPRLRHAALDDPDAGPDLVMKLIDDPAVGCWALRDPRLPAGELLRRLTVPGSAWYAAANPALPPATMHRLLDLAGVGPAPVR